MSGLRFAVLALALALAAAPLPCLSAQTGESPVVMRIGHAQPVTHPRHKSLLLFKELVRERTEGRIRVDIFPAGQLGDEASMLAATKIGTLQATRGGLFELVSPRLLVYTLPFLFDDLDGIEKVTMGPIGERIAKEAERNGICILATGDAGGFRQITNDLRPVRSPEDLEGMRIRVPDVSTIVRTFEAFGATPVSIPYGETYQALKSGIADGQENPFVNIEAMRFYEVQKFLTVLDYQFHPDPFNVNLAWYRALPPQDQRILKECAVESMRYNNRLVRSASVAAYGKLRNALEVRVLGPVQRQAFEERARGVYGYFIAKGVTSLEEIEEIRSAAR